MKPDLLIIDDDEDIRSQMKWALVSDYEVHLAEDRPTGIAAFQKVRPAVVLLDLGLPPNPGTPEEGLETLSELMSAQAQTKVIIVSGQNEKAVSLEAVGKGAYDFLSKPVDMDELQIILKRAYHVALLEREYQRMQDLLKNDTFQGMLGTSPQMQKVFSSIRKVATTDAPVLILGESGTGKEMAALAVHRSSSRKHGPFVAINCGAIPENLLESELFGHEKGSFTGAHAQRLGRIESANGGTLFLDEVGELPLALQVKLLRFLQEQRIERVGGRKEIEIDTRVLAATNADVLQDMKEGTFREDLYYRLAVVVINLPPLRERTSDAIVLAQAFLKKFAVEAGKTSAKFNKEATKVIAHYEWPGNVRELENRVRRAIIMAEGNYVTAQDLELSDLLESATIRTLKDAREELERGMVQEALARNKGKISPAATELGISRPTFYELMEKLGLKREKASDNSDG